MITAAPDVATMAAEYDERSAEIERTEAELADMAAAREAARIALDAVRAEIEHHLGDGSRTARAGQRYASRGAVSRVDSWGDDSELGVDEVLSERTRLRAELTRLDQESARLRASVKTWRAELVSLESAILAAAAAAEPEPAAVAPVPEPAPAHVPARTWRPRPSHIPRPAAVSRPRATTPPPWTWPAVPVPAPVAPAEPAGRPLASWTAPAVPGTPRASRAGRVLAAVLAALLCLTAGSLVTFALSGPAWFGVLASFAVWECAQAGANISRGRLTAAVNGGTPWISRLSV